jgi:hypothetical protein
MIMFTSFLRSRMAVCSLASLLLLSVSSHQDANAGTLAFPGAEGFGAVSIGGRGGMVVKVTNLNSSGPGSLQAACEAEGPRIVIFDVGGVIRGDVKIRHPHITIAGQTAPSPGITIEGRLLARPEPWKRMSDIVVRFIRIRPLPTVGHDGDVIQLPDTERVILDHLSLSWANDEMIDLCHSSEVTVQWCTVEESDTEGHAKGMHNLALISAYPRSGNLSVHHNLFAHHAGRIPSLSPYDADKPGDFRNNVVYNFSSGLTHDGHTPKAPINIVGNYYKRGPNAFFVRPFEFHESGSYYIGGNYIESVGEIGDPRLPATKLPYWMRVSKAGVVLHAPAAVARVTTQSAQQAYTLVTEQSGCFPRDRVTTRTIKELMSGTGSWGRKAPAAPSDAWYLEGLAYDKAPPDSDGDGIPDIWEDTHGLNKNDSRDRNRKMPTGYTAIEEYINDRAALLLRQHRE